MRITHPSDSRGSPRSQRLLHAIVGILLFAVAMLLWPLQGSAATYAYTNDTFSYDTPSGTARTVSWHTSGASPACTSYPNGDDDWADIVFSTATSPANTFTFTFGGVVYNQVRVYSNGMLAFGTDDSGYWRQFSNGTLPITTASSRTYSGCPNNVPENLMAVYWLDTVAGTANSTSGASVKFELLGTAPNRRLVISWVNVKLYNETPRYNYQVALYESPGGGVNSNFKYQYTTGSSTGATATVGVQLTTSDSTLYSYNQAFIDPATGTAILWYPADQPATKSAEYRFEEATWNGTAGEVKDSSGAGNHAVMVGSVRTDPDGKICRGGDLDNNGSASTVEGVSTPMRPGSAGTIDLWYYSNSRWNQNNAMLLDATTTASRPFYFMRTSTGTLKFSVSDASGTVLSLTSAAQGFGSNTWVHVGISWKLLPGTNQSRIQIFLNGALLASTRGTTSGTIASLSTVMIGDNRTSGVTPTGGTGTAVNGILDEVNFYSGELNATQVAADTNATRSSCSGIDHFHVVHNGSAVACEITPITIEAHDAAHALVSASGLTLSLSTSTNRGNWSNVTGGALNSISNLGSGAASYSFGSESSVIFGLQDLTVESLTIGASSGSTSTTSGAAASCVAVDYTYGSTCNTALSFVAAGFRFVNASGSPIGNQVAGATSGIYYLQAVRQSNNSSACTSLFPSGSAVNIELGYECNNPTSCQGGQAFTFTPGAGAGTAGTIASNANGGIGAGSGSYTTRALTFNAASPLPLPAVPFTFNYTDVGRVRLWARYTPAGGTTISGNSQFILAPAAFTFNAITTGPIRAGGAFGATVNAVNAAGNPTPNFGQETSPESVTISFSRCQPAGAGASNGILSGNGGPFAFTAGSSAISGLNWSEVGRIDLTATLASGNYLGSNLTATGNSGTGGTLCNGNGNVGAFIPHHFDTQVLTHGCGSFTYAGQPFTLRVTARNGLASPTTTVNYDGSASTAPNFARALTLSDTSGASGTLSPTTAAATNFVAGVATLSTPTWTFPTPLTTPATIVLRAVDADGVTSSGYESAASAPIRSGRLTLSNGFGSEKSPLNLSVQTQFWNGSWVTNASDSCTVLPVSAIALSGYTGTLSLGSFGGTPVSCVSTPVNYCDAGNDLKVIGGVSYLKLAAPQPNTGSVSVAANLGASGVDQSCLASHGGSPAALPWLRGRFGSCAAATSFTADPSARASFGIYSPETRKLIHMRELY